MPKKIMWRWIITLLIIVGSLASALYYGFNLGIDLRGGWEAVYSIKWDEDMAAVKPNTERIKRIIEERIDPTGMLEATVQVIGGDRIRIVIPFSEDTDVGEIKQRVENIGRLEWLLVQDDEEYIKAAADKEPNKPFTVNSTRFVRMNYKKLPPGEEDEEKKRSRDYEVFIVKHRKSPEMHLTGSDLKSCHFTQDNNGQPAIGFAFKGPAQKRFGVLTADHVGERLAVVYDNQVVSAPVIREAIYGPGIISGRFSEKEANRMIDTINAGSLDMPLTYDSGLFVGSSLGEDAMSAGKRAILIAGIVVLVFMALYYLACGLVANMALMMNLVIILGVLSYCNATLTLPGMAGLLLTIGMAVDANVLVFERIREEKTKGREVETAFKNGYGKAFWTIFDANITTFITAWILFSVGSTAIKGFAVVLMIGIITSMFTALFVTRWVFTVLYRFGAIKQFKMKRFPFLESTHIRFTAAAKVCVTISLILIVLGIGAFVSRLGDIFDTAFTGGSYLVVDLDEESEVADIRKRITEADYPGAEVQIVHKEQAALGQSKGKSFSIRVAAAQDIYIKHIGEKAEGEIAGDYAERFRRRFEDDMKKVFINDIEHRDVEVKVDIFKQTTLPGADKMIKAARVDIELEPAVKLSDVRRAVKDCGYDIATLEFPDNPKVKAYDEALKKDGKIKIAKEPMVSRFVFKSTDKNVDEINVKGSLAGQLKVVKPFNSQYIGPQVAGEQRGAAIFAMLCALVAIVIYIWFRFGRVRYGLAAIVALAHDVLITVGAIAALGWIAKVTGSDLMGVASIKIDLTIVAAILTIIGYSLNDTIVVFDRIRENTVGHREPDAEVIDRSLNQVLGRTMLTSLTTFVAVVVLFFIGGSGLHGFAFSMMIGVVVGTYSSMFIASPIVIWKHLGWKVGGLTESKAANQ